MLLPTLHWRYVGGQITPLQLQQEMIFGSKLDGINLAAE